MTKFQIFPADSKGLVQLGSDYDQVILHLCETLLTTFSVTAALQVWCEVRDIGEGELRADLHESSGSRELPLQGVEWLKPQEDETVRHRFITLRRGDAPLLDADNWYIHERLPAEAQHLLDDTDTPFGRALAGTLQNRETPSAHLPSRIMKRFRGREQIRNTRMYANPTVPVLTVRGLVTIDTIPVSYVEERIRTELIERSAKAADF